MSHAIIKFLHIAKGFKPRHKLEVRTRQIYNSSALEAFLKKSTLLTQQVKTRRAS